MGYFGLTSLTTVASDDRREIMDGYLHCKRVYAGKSFSSTGIRTQSGSSAGQSLSVGLSVSIIAYALFCDVVFVS